MLIAASVVAAIRLRGEDIRPSPKLEAVVERLSDAGQNNIGAYGIAKLGVHDPLVWLYDPCS